MPNMVHTCDGNVMLVMYNAIVQSCDTTTHYTKTPLLWIVEVMPFGYETNVVKSVYWILYWMLFLYVCLYRWGIVFYYPS